MTDKYKPIRRVSRSNRDRQGDRLRYEHWHVNNQVYFITARCRDGFPAFRTERAKGIFWERFGHYADRFGYMPWVTSLVKNHYHTLGYLREGQNLSTMM